MSRYTGFFVFLLRAATVGLALAALASAQTTAPPQRAETVVVTGTAAPVPLNELDRSVGVQTDIPARVLLFGGLNNILQLDSSVDLAQRNPGVQGDISIRGGTFAQTLVLVDGVRINDVQSAHHNLDVPVPLDAIDRVEILRGSGSTFYGSDAVGGVVNVITRVNPEPELRVRAGAGSFGTNSESGLLSFGSSALAQQFSFERERSEGFRDDREYRSTAGSSETLLRTPLGATTLLLSALDRPFGADQFYGRFNSWERTKTWYASLHQDLGSRTYVTTSYRRHTDLFVLLRDKPQVYTNHHADDGWDVAVRRTDPAWRRSTLAYGLEGLTDGLDSNNLGHHRRYRGAAYGAFDIRALHRFSFSAGAREEVFGHGDSFFAPSLSGGFWLLRNVKLRGSIGRAFRLPTYTDLYYSDPASRGNPALRPEQATTYEAGVDWHIGPRWTASATVFRRNSSNGIDYVRQAPGQPYVATNFDRLQFTGVEAQVDAHIASGQLLGFAYSGLHGSQDLPGNAQSRYVFNFPDHEAVAVWQALSHAGVLGRTRVGVLNRHRRDPYALWDLYAAVVRYRVRPFLQLTNLAGVHYQEISGVDMPGRAILGGLEICLFCIKH